MKKQINKTRAFAAAALVLTLLGQGASQMEQNMEVQINEPIGLTYYDTTAEPVGTDENGEWNQQEGMQDSNQTGIQDPNQTIENATEFKDEEILYSSYYSYGSGCFSVELVKEDLDVTSSGAIAASMSNSGIVSSQELLDACLSEEEKAELEAGVNKEIRVTMKQMVVEGLSEGQYELLKQAEDEYTKLYKGFQTSSYLKISIAKKNEKGKWKKIKKLNNDIKIHIDIPQISQIPEAKEYYLIQIRNGEYSITEDENNYLETMTTSVSGAAMCAIGYTLPVVEATPTAAPVEKLSYWEQMTNGDFCIWHWFDIAILLIGITWLLAIESKKIRIIFLSVVSILCVILAIMGSCVYDWPFAVGSIVIMVLTHVGRVYYKRNKKNGKK